MQEMSKELQETIEFCKMWYTWDYKKHGILCMSRLFKWVIPNKIHMYRNTYFYHRWTTHQSSFIFIVY